MAGCAAVRLQLQRRARDNARYLILLQALPFGFVFQALFGEAKALVVAVFASESGQFAANFPQPTPAVVHVADAFEEVECSGQFCRDDDAEPFGDLAAIADGVQLGDVFEDGLEAIAPVFVPEPFFKAAVPPFREISVVDGAAAESLSEHLAALGQFVDPLNNFRTGLAVAEAAV
jgi:hypothetical protein